MSYCFELQHLQYFVFGPAGTFYHAPPPGPGMQATFICKNADCKNNREDTVDARQRHANAAVARQCCDRSLIAPAIEL
jgi:hypothetical protein